MDQSDKTLIDISNWKRKDHFNFFSAFEEPFYGMTVKVDCTIAYQQAKKNNVSFFLYYLYRALKAANSIENFRYRIINNNVYLYDTINASPTVNKPDGTFGFSYMSFYEDENLFYDFAKQEIERVRMSSGLDPALSGENVIHFSAIPWVDFSSLSHARSFSHSDSCPKISFGKITEENSLKKMPVAVHAHHGLVDGYHIGLFIERFQELLNN
ncbi:CatA-like O-acetyltransferase [Winogradskyella poriferorum]|uniref:CatA-like O-acetyltransferase n=1 Tax=Winogradskyella poriferorum TaxID=307627 RepID=UPI003D64A613